MDYKDAREEDIDLVVEDAWKAFLVYRKWPRQRRVEFMKEIARQVEACGDELIQVAIAETNLPEARLRNERARTIFQLNSYADACMSGDWLEARIDTANTERNPPKPDVRKMLIPLGPVAVFGASNFPFAYSTAGGDTACAFAAGCPVIVKAHPAHIKTSTMVAEAILKAADIWKMPPGIFGHIYGAGPEAGKILVSHPHVKAVGFTGSYQGGKQLFDWGNQRPEPIPVFAEMGSINPVFLLPEKLKQSVDEIAGMYASSITLGVGQFCTNPGLIIAVDSEWLRQFMQALADKIKQAEPGAMLHPGIFKSYVEKRALALSQEEVTTLAVAEKTPIVNEGAPTIASATGKAFLNNPILHQEVFGPYSIIIRCKDETEMLKVVRRLEGQLTATLMATENDINYHEELVEAIKNICGRMIYNGVPTGVEVCLAMQHGGPFPATTDSRFSSVGADGIKRFARPIAFQNWPDAMLPEELQNANPGNIWRTVNNDLNKGAI